MDINDISHKEFCFVSALTFGPQQNYSGPKYSWFLEMVSAVKLIEINSMELEIYGPSISLPQP